MFYDTSRFPFIKDLEENWEEIRSEYNQANTIPYPEDDLYTGEWDVSPFLFFGTDFAQNRKKCPKTWKLLESIPNLVNASFSILNYSTDIKPHTGFTKEVLRCHLGLIVPSRCLLVVGDEPMRWEEGKCLVFDDTIEHYAYNHSETDRVVLLLDFKR